MTKTEIEELSKLPFEKTLEKLEAAVYKMESGNLPLEEMMDTFEEGQTLAAICEKKLKVVEKKIEILRKRTDDNVEWASFENEPQNRRTPPVPAPVSVPVSVPVPVPVPVKKAQELSETTKLQDEDFLF